MFYPFLLSGQRTDPGASPSFAGLALTGNMTVAAGFTLTGAGSLSFIAAGTNQNITLTPSGSTGRVLVGLTPSFNSSTLSVKPATGARGFSVEAQSSDAVVRLWHDGTTANVGSDYQATAGYKPLAFHLSNVEKARFAISGNLLLGALTTDGTGVLQLPLATTSAGGVTFGDVFVYRGAADMLHVLGTSTNVSFRLLQTGAATGVGFGCNAGAAFIDTFVAGQSLTLRTSNQQTALTLDSSQGTTAAGKLVSANATAGVGYATGAGGTVTQATSRTTGVTLNKVCGAITLVSAAGSATWQSFTVTNSAVAATDTVDVCQKSGTDLCMVAVTAVAAGSFRISFATTGGTTVEQPVFNFTVTKAVTA